MPDVRADPEGGHAQRGTKSEVEPIEPALLADSNNRIATSHEEAALTTVGDRASFASSLESRLNLVR
jgi:hypothetical protein